MLAFLYINGSSKRVINYDLIYLALLWLMESWLQSFSVFSIYIAFPVVQATTSTACVFTHFM